MQNLMEHASFVNEQAAFHERQAIKYGAEPKRATMHSASAAKFRALAATLSQYAESERLKAERQRRGMGLAWSDLEGLPDDLLAELSISESDRADFNLMNLIEQAGGIASIDQLLIALYRQSGEVNKRSVITARLYRMANKGLIYSVPGKKGVYSLELIAGDDSDVADDENDEALHDDESDPTGQPKALAPAVPQSPRYIRIRPRARIILEATRDEQKE